MTFSKVLLMMLCIFLMFSSLCIGQESESNTTSIYMTCDFDLENIETLLQYLPDICTEIYNNRFVATDLYDLYMEESQNFGKFYKKLDDYELRSVHGEEELQVYPFETKLRNEAYAKVDWADCIITANSSATDFLTCVKVKRLELFELIPSVNAKLL